MNPAQDSGSWLLRTKSPVPETPPGASYAGSDTLGTPLLEHYEVGQVIGVGGMAVVYEGRDKRSGQRVAIKMLRPELASRADAAHRFVREAEHMRKLAHPRVLPVLEICEGPKGPVLVAPFMERGSLARLLEGEEPLAPEFILRFTRQVAEALVQAHKQGIIHGDVKPANVLLDAEGNALLADFGLARRTLNDSMLDLPGAALTGTLPYLSPAVVRGEVEDTRRDIYGLGALLYHALTGKPPYADSKDILHEIRTGPPKPIRELNPAADAGLTAVAERAMAREQRERYANAGDLLADLEKVENGGVPVGTGNRGAGRLWGLAWPLPGRRGWAMLATGAFAALTLVAWLLLGNSAPTIKAPPRVTVPQGRNLDVPVSVADKETPLERLAVSASSSDTQLLTVGKPERTVRPGEWTVEVKGKNLVGTGALSVAVSDGTKRKTARVAVEVVSNTPPDIVFQGTPVVLTNALTAVPLRVVDRETPGGEFYVNAQSSDRAVARDLGTPQHVGGEECWVWLQTGSQTGQVRLLVSAVDGMLSPTWYLPVAVATSNTAPVLEPPDAVPTLVPGQESRLSIGLSKNAGTPGELRAVGRSSDDTVVRVLGVQVQPAGKSLVVALRAGDRAGTSEVAVAVSDGTASRSLAFKVPVCQAVVTQYVTLPLTPHVYHAADQVSLRAEGRRLAAGLRYQVFNVGTPGLQDQLFLAADKTVLAPICDSAPGRCPGVTAVWTNGSISLERLQPGTFTLYFAAMMATNMAQAIALYETTDPGLKVPIGKLTIAADTREVRVQPVVP